MISSDFNSYGGTEEEDIYAGYDDYTLETENAIEFDEGFQEALKTSKGGRPKVSLIQPPQTGAFGRTKTAIPQSSMGRPKTGMYQKSVGYGSEGQNVAPTLEKKASSSPDETYKALEKKVNISVEQSALAAKKKDLQKALDKGKEALKREAQLRKQREQAGVAITEQNLDLTYAVYFNLSLRYTDSLMYQEALSTYNLIIKNKLLSNSGRIRINMGNIYFRQEKYPQAIKMYRMAFDQIKQIHQLTKAKLMRNIGNAFVKMGHYSEAVQSYESIMDIQPDYVSGFNAILCYFALGDRERMCKGFKDLLNCSLEYISDADLYQDMGIENSDDVDANNLAEAVKSDLLSTYEFEQRGLFERNVILTAKLIAPAIETDFATGYDWCIEQVKNSIHADLGSELEITKAIAYLKVKEFDEAIATFKHFEKKDSRMAAKASTNLSFLYFLENKVQEASKHADIAIEEDRFNAAALINKGNCLFKEKNYETALEYYKEAISIDASVTEAIYNLGLTEKKLGLLEESKSNFMKLHKILGEDPEVIYQLASIYDKQENKQEAIEWFNRLITVVPTDPNILARLGEIYDQEDDKSQAFQYHLESYQYYPSNIEVISWLGAYYVDSSYYEQAIVYFDRAALIEPGQVKWFLMVASCHRRSGNYQKALDTYRKIHDKFPDNLDCLKFLVRICTDLGMKEVQEYAIKLRKLQKTRDREEAEQEGHVVYTEDTPPQKSRSKSRPSVSKESSDHDHRPSKGGAGEIDIDAAYEDPLGNITRKKDPRPKHGGSKWKGDDGEGEQDEWANEELGDDMLPE